MMERFNAIIERIQKEHGRFQWQCEHAMREKAERMTEHDLEQWCQSLERIEQSLQRRKQQ